MILLPKIHSQMNAYTAATEPTRAVARGTPTSTSITPRQLYENPARQTDGAGHRHENLHRRE
jgi:hypothetical protein